MLIKFSSWKAALNAFQSEFLSLVQNDTRSSFILWKYNACIYILIVWELNSKSDQIYAEEQGDPLVQSETDYNIQQL